VAMESAEACSHGRMLELVNEVIKAWKGLFWPSGEEAEPVVARNGVRHSIGNVTALAGGPSFEQWERTWEQSLLESCWCHEMGRWTLPVDAVVPPCSRMESHKMHLGAVLMVLDEKQRRPATERFVMLSSVRAITCVVHAPEEQLAEALRVADVFEDLTLQLSVLSAVTVLWCRNEWGELPLKNLGSRYCTVPQEEAVVGTAGGAECCALSLAARVVSSLSVFSWLLSKCYENRRSCTNIGCIGLQSSVVEAAKAGRDDNGLALLKVMRCQKSQNGCAPFHTLAFEQEELWISQLFRLAIANGCDKVAAAFLTWEPRPVVVNSNDLMSAISVRRIAVETIRLMVDAVQDRERETKERIFRGEWVRLWNGAVKSNRPDVLQLLKELENWEETEARFSNNGSIEDGTNDDSQDESARDPGGAPMNWADIYADGYFVLSRPEALDTSLQLACENGAAESVAFLLAQTQLKCIPTRELCCLAADRCFSDVLGVLLFRAKETSLLADCLKQNYKDTTEGGVLHVLCNASGSDEAKEKCFSVIRQVLSVTRKGLSGNEVVLDDLSWFDDTGHLPIDYASGQFREKLAGFFPADALWNNLRIEPKLFRRRVGIVEDKGGSGARLEKWEYVDKSCVVAVKKYPSGASVMESIRREVGIMVNVRFPFILRILGWSYFDCGRSLGVVMDLCYGSLRRTVRRFGSRMPTFTKARWARQVGSALQFLHGREPVITHGDVHLLNVLVRSTFDSKNLASLELVNVVLCDFEFSCISGTRARVVSGIENFPRFSGTGTDVHSVESLKAIDWLMYGMLMFSVSIPSFFSVFSNLQYQIASNGHWDWRKRQVHLKETISWDSADLILRLPLGTTDIVRNVIRGAWESSGEETPFDLDQVEEMMENMHKLEWANPISPSL
jgi:hypothetical protein